MVEEPWLLPGRPEHARALKLNRLSKDAYPAVLVSYALVCEAYKDANNAALVKGFIGYAASTEGQKAACPLYTSPSPRDRTSHRMPSSA